MRSVRATAALALLLLLTTRATMAGETSRLPDFDARWDYDHPDSTESRFREILPTARASGDRDYLAQLLTQIARCQGLRMRFDEAWATLDEAEGLIAPGMETARVRLLLERGRVLNSSKRREASRPLFLEAWERARVAGADRFAVDAAHMLGIVEPGDSSLAWNRRAVEVAESSADPAARKWLGSLYNNIGWTYHDQGDDGTALDYFRKALREREAQGDAASVRVARWCVARALRSLGRLEEALAAQSELRKDALAAGSPDGYIEEEIAECLAALGRGGEATPHFAEAYRLLSTDPWLQRDEPARLERLRRLGESPEPAREKP